MISGLSWKHNKDVLLFLRFHLSLHAVGYVSLSPLPPEDVLDPGVEPVSPALAGRFFTAEPLGKPFELYSSLILQKAHQNLP